MFLFTRAGRLAPGHLREGMAYVAAISERVHQESGLDIHTYRAALSPELGTIVWSAFVEDLEELEAADDKLAVSDAYLELADKGGHLFAGPFRDRIGTIVSGDMDATGPLPAYVGVARGASVNGKLREAMAAGVEIAETATAITGIRTAFVVDGTGEFGGCRWLTSYPDIAGVQRGEAALMADERWMRLLDRVGTDFQPGVSQSVYRRMI